MIPTDGKVAGNGATKVMLNGVFYTLVTKSGRYAGEMDVLNSMCLISEFDTESWSCVYYSEHDDIRPTSDSPMHWCVLNLSPSKTVAETPTAALHGHALATAEEAEKFNFPFSRETLFSTPEDTEVMIEMLTEYTYPNHKVFIRLNHGYYILGQDVIDCRNVLHSEIIKKM